MASTNTSFQDLLSQVSKTETDNTFSARITEDWTQGRAAFGGITAALAIRALRQHLSIERPLRTMMGAFVGPIAADQLNIHCEHLRSGKSTTWARADVRQNSSVCTAFSACFGEARSSAIKVAPTTRPETLSPEQSTLFDFATAPRFTQHFDMRWAIGNMPVTGSKESEVGAWVKFRDSTRFDIEHIITLMDLLPPAVLQMFREFRPISSLSWHLEMLDDLEQPDARDADGWWFFHVAARNAAQGYSHQHATLYTPAGRALAMSQQTVAIFA